MSPNNPGNFVNDLVEMAKAFEALPKVQAELETAYKALAIDGETIQRLELKLMERDKDIAVHLQHIRSLEVERDEAQFHALEADERTSRALDFIKATFGNAGSLIQALEPPKPEPVAAPEQPTGQHWATQDEANQPQGESASPLPSVNTTEQPASANMPTASMADASTQTNPPSSAPEVAAQPGPSQDIAPTQSPSTSGATDASTSGSPVDQSFSMPAQSKPFAGRRYSDVVKAGTYPNREEWEAGGGTVDNWYA